MVDVVVRWLYGGGSGCGGCTVVGVLEYDGGGGRGGGCTMVGVVVVAQKR